MVVKENLSKNLVKYRKSFKLTQAELAEKLNYSDKAVSKWERGESMPDLSVLKQIALFYGVSVDDLLAPPEDSVKPTLKERLKTKRAILCLCCLGLILLVAICGFAFIDILFPSIKQTYLSFILALPAYSIVLLVFSCKWKKRVITAIFASLTVWTSLLFTYLLLLEFLPVPPHNLWEIFLIGAALQLLIIFWTVYRKLKNIKPKNKKTKTEL